MRPNRRNCLKSIIFSIFVIFISLLFFTTCAKKEDSQSVVQEEPTSYGSIKVFDFSKSITIGNISWLLIDRRGRPSDNVELILKMIDEFKKKNPNIQVVRWQIEKTQSSETRSDRIHGIWIDWIDKKDLANPAPERTTNEIP